MKEDNFEVCNNIKDKVKEVRNIQYCPICGNKGQGVLATTIKNLVKVEFENKVKEKVYFLCMNEECEAAYYNLNGEVLKISELKVPLWFKNNANPKYICYCNYVTEEDIVDAVVNKGAKDIKEVSEITGAMKNGNCKMNNPLGKCCGPLIKEIIKRELELKEK